jgi:site-specific recombinase XerD
MGAPEIVEFLGNLATVGRVSASTQNQALSSILFLYREVLAVEPDRLVGLVRAQRPVRLPIVLTRTEVGALLGPMRGDTWLMGRSSTERGSGSSSAACCASRTWTSTAGRFECATARDARIA